MKIELILLFMVIPVVMVSGCVSQENPRDTSTDSISGSNIERLEIYHFHGTNQCYSCITVGAYAEETVNVYFSDELKSGKIVFGHINGELPENRGLVIKYGAAGSSLWLGITTKDGNFSKEENVNVWYKIGNKEDYMSYLKALIEKRLAGDMS